MLIRQISRIAEFKNSFKYDRVGSIYNRGDE
jgi:hypothetical protein